MSVGKILEKEFLIIGEVIGEATWNGRDYEMARSLTNAMIVRDIQTDKQYVLDWKKVIDEAVIAGISEETIK